MRTLLIALLFVPPQEIRHARECPAECKPCGEALRKGLAYLDSQITKLPDNEGTPWRPSLEALCALAFVGSDDTRYGEAAARARRDLAAYLNRVKGQDVYQANWPVAFTGWMLAELAARKRGDDAMAKKVVEILQEAQREDGGWGHSAKQTGYAEHGYPRTLFVTSNVSLIAIGLLRRQGVKVADGAIERALKHYERAQLKGKKAPEGFGTIAKHLDKDGGFPYDATQNAGGEPGRTAGAWWALWAAGAGESETARRAAAFLRETLSDLPEGHASSALHVFSGAVACRLQGGDAWKEFNRLFRDRILRAQQTDGSFKCICSGNVFNCSEPHFEGRMAGPDPERIYVTVLYVLILELDRLKILQPGVAKKGDSPREPTPTPGSKK